MNSVLNPATENSGRDKQTRACTNIKGLRIKEESSMKKEGKKGGLWLGPCQVETQIDITFTARVSGCIEVKCFAGNRY